ncbi:acyltransferase [Micromonospora sp. WMMD987]|uniref:acyltransferase family protein n=1 Tax=Micromonospora TaxID=1873 RepID=UPI00249B3A01|nr:acyltransferase [Micromonospora sp. WMMD987]WFE95427.1 acyltransferase [Micromonospora sp. WMMD987]
MSTDQLPPREAVHSPVHRLSSLTGLRWVAAMMVFATHAAFQPGLLPYTETTETIKAVVKMGGYIGVGFFFVLSGFVLTWSMRDDDTAGRFWRRRFFKIYPNHLVTLLLAVVVMVASGRELVGLVPNVLLLQAWWTDLDVAFGINDVSWSLSVEALFYLSFPLLIRWIRRIRPERLWYWAGGVMLAVLCVPVVAKLLPDEPQVWWEPMSALEYWFIYVFPPVRMLDFVLGILLARLVMTGRWPRVRVWWAVVAFLAGYAAASVLPTGFAMVSATIVPLAFLIPAVAARDIAGRPSFLGGRVMVWLGDISFAFYMLHELVLYNMYPVYGPDFRPNGWQSLGLLTFGLSATILLSWALFRLVERPMQRRFSVSRRRVDAVVGGGTPTGR